MVRFGMVIKAGIPSSLSSVALIPALSRSDLTFFLVCIVNITCARLERRTMKRRANDMTGLIIETWEISSDCELAWRMKSFLDF
jgi:hypothetical protein